MKFRKFFAIAALLALGGCDKDADVVSRNISTDADNFKINRRIVFINGITGQNMLVVEGLCSLGNNDSAKRMSVTCRIGPSKYIKHMVGTSDNVTFVAEQIDPVESSPYFYKRVFKPTALIPDIEIR